MTPISITRIGSEEAEPSIANIKAACAEVFGITLVQLVGLRRKHVRARHAAFFLSADLTSQSYPAIGRQFGDRHHTSIMHGVKNCERWMREDPAYAAQVAAAVAVIPELHSPSEGCVDNAKLGIEFAAQMNQ